MTAMRLAVLDLPEGNAMRAPGEAPGLMALEIAMDEMAEKLGMDPVSSASSTTPRSIPRSPSAASRSATWSTACAPAPSASAGASATRSPASVRDGPLAGRHGRGGRLPQQPGHEVGGARAPRRHGIVTVETDMTDIGTGSYTIIAQTAAEMMGVPIDKVVVRLGDSTSRSRPARAGNGAATARRPACMRPA